LDMRVIVKDNTSLKARKIPENRREFWVLGRPGILFLDGFECENPRTINFKFVLEIKFK
jgi:hypothetical protein